MNFLLVLNYCNLINGLLEFILELLKIIELRNASYKNVSHICNFIKKSGGEVVFTGTNNFMNLGCQKNIYFLNDLELEKVRINCCNYISGQSYFFYW